MRYLTSLLIAAAMSLPLSLVAVAPSLAAEGVITYDPPIQRHGVGCSSHDDVMKFVAFIKTVPGDMPTVVALMLAQSQGIQCSSGAADIVKEEIVDHFVWIDGSKMLMIHYTFVNGHDVFTWREDKLAEPSACVGRCI